MEAPYQSVKTHHPSSNLVRYHHLQLRLHGDRVHVSAEIRERGKGHCARQCRLVGENDQGDTEHDRGRDDQPAFVTDPAAPPSGRYHPDKCAHSAGSHQHPCTNLIAVQRAQGEDGDQLDIGRPEHAIDEYSANHQRQNRRHEDVADSLSGALPECHALPTAMQLGHLNAGYRHHHSGVGNGVKKIARDGPPEEQEGGNGRANESHGLPHHGSHGNGAHDVLAVVHEIRDKRLAGRLVESGDGTRDKRGDEDIEHGQPAGQRKDGHDEAEDGPRPLGSHYQTDAVQPVGHLASQHVEDDAADSVAQPNKAGLRGRIPRHLRDDKLVGKERYVLARGHAEQAEPVVPVVAILEGGKHRVLPDLLD